MTKALAIACGILALIVALLGAAWQYERAEYATYRTGVAEQIAAAQTKVREEVTRAREADVAAVGRERDAALERARRAEAARRAVEAAPVEVMPLALDAAIDSRGGRP